MKTIEELGIGVFREILEAVPDAMVIMNQEGEIVFVNEQTELLFGYLREELLGQQLSILVPDRFRDQHRGHQDKYFSKPRSRHMDHYLHITGRRKDGTEIAVKVSLHPLHTNNETLVLSSIRDITESSRIELQAITDSLTGINNRRRIDTLLDEEWRRACRAQTPFSIIMIDIDLFKRYNDIYGHVAGDVCLTKIAQTLKTSLHRPGDHVGRYGGEEFLAVLPGTPLIGATNVAEKMRTTIEDLHLQHRESPIGWVTISLGIATFDAYHESVKKDLENLIKEADKALYRAKELGRNYSEPHTSVAEVYVDDHKERS